MAILTLPTERELASFVGAYSLGGMQRATGIEAGTVNTSYALELDAGRFFLRIYEEQDHAGAAREAQVLTHLAGHGVLTPAPIVGDDGASVRVIAGKAGALFPWIDGDMLCTRSVTPAAARAVGVALARIHVAGHAPLAPLDAGRFGPRDLVKRCERVAASRDPEARTIASALREAVTEVARARETRGPVPSGLIHGDLFRDNVLWERGTETTPACRIAALLDFESAHDGPFAYDIAVTILSWAYASGPKLEPDLARAVVDGYRTVRELSERETSTLFEEAIFASLRFTITRITDDAIRVGKRWQRFVERREAIERMGPRGLLEVLGL